MLLHKISKIVVLIVCFRLNYFSKATWENGSWKDEIKVDLTEICSEAVE
jgi:hypothetical protein